MKISKYELLNDAEWLEQKYIVEKLSTIEIANIIGCKSCASVRKYLINHGIKVRTKSDGHTCNRITDNFVLNQPVIEGCLLGDGFFKLKNKYSEESNPSFGKTNIGFDHILYVANQIFTSDAKNRIFEYDNNNSGYANSKQVFTLRSLTHKELKPLCNKWYPVSNDYKKVIPEDIEISPELLLHWFMDDGRSYQRRKEHHRVKQICVEFACQSFNKDELQMLADKIYDKFSLKMTPTLHQRHGIIKGTGMDMFVPQSQVPLFYEIIGECPVPSMQYKWK
jgi:hypothetical protein